MSILSRRTPPRHAKPQPMLFRIPDPAGGPGIVIPPNQPESLGVLQRVRDGLLAHPADGSEGEAA